MSIRSYGMALIAVGLLASTTLAATPEELIQVIQEVSKKGEGHSRATAAVVELQTAGVEAAIPVLTAMDHANPLAFNWLQVAFESIADQAMKEDKLSSQSLEAFVVDRTHNGRSRKVAFDWLSKVDNTAFDRLVPQMLDDPSGPLRREAVAMVIGQARQATGETAQAALWNKALAGAVDRDQVDTIADALKKLGETVDLVEHFGLLTEWYVVGPFDNSDMKGFDVVYPPEKEVDLNAEYAGKTGMVAWTKLVSDRDDGEFDLAELTEPHKGAIDYAYSEFHSGHEQEVEFRLATANAWKLWVNGELVFAREEYHRGMRFDQYIVRGGIRKGKNTFLLKVCQNEQTQSWAQRWAFQFRVVDQSGRAVTQVE